MGFLKAILFIVFFFAIQYYLYKKIKGVLFTVFKNKTERAYLILKTVFILYNLFPFFWLSQALIRTTGIITQFYVPKNLVFDYFMIYPFWLIFILFIQILPFFLFSDILRLSLLKLYKKNRERYLELQSKALISITCLFLIYIPIRIIYDDVQINTSEFTHTIDDLHPSLHDLKIVLISDIQADYYTNESRLTSYIDKVNSLNPDLVFIAGDMITNTPDYIDLAGEMASKLKARYGVYAGPGDHDHWAYSGRSPESFQKSLNRIKSTFNAGNVPLIINENTEITIGSAKIKLTSTDQNYAYRQISRTLLDSLAKSGNESANLKIFLNHQPNLDLVEKAKEYEYDMFLAGHTHGGQVVFWYPPWFMISGTTLTEPTYVKGKYIDENLLVAVSAGLGVSIAPVRYNATPEIVSIKLKSKSNELVAKKNKN